MALSRWLSLVLSLGRVCIDALLPPRESERLVAQTRAADLLDIPRGQSGALDYRDPLVRALVWEVKYHANSQALALLGPVLAAAIQDIVGEESGQALLVPIPMHSARRRERGHNQTELLCEVALPLVSEGCVVYAPRALVRERHTPKQQGLPEHQRRHNVANAMHADRNIVAGRAVIVVDDVETTGATLKEAARALRSAGARAVYPIALAQS